MTTTEIRKANRVLASLAFNRTHTLSSFIDEARRIHPEVATALEGIWCGRNGTCVVELDARHMLCIDWYNGRVEVAYIS